MGATAGENHRQDRLRLPAAGEALDRLCGRGGPYLTSRAASRCPRQCRAPRRRARQAAAGSSPPRRTGGRPVPCRAARASPRRRGRPPLGVSHSRFSGVSELDDERPQACPRPVHGVTEGDIGRPLGDLRLELQHLGNRPLHVAPLANAPAKPPSRSRTSPIKGESVNAIAGSGGGVAPPAGSAAAPSSLAPEATDAVRPDPQPAPPPPPAARRSSRWCRPRRFGTVRRHAPSRRRDPRWHRRPRQGRR